MRVLWLIDSLTVGGAESLTAAIAGEARRRGWELTVAFLKRLGDNAYEETVRAAGVPVVHLAAKNLRDVAAYRRLGRLLGSGGFDVVHAHLAYASIWAALAASAVGVPLVATLHVAPEPVPLLSREGLRRRLLVALLARRAARVVAVSRALAETWAEAGLPAARLTVVHNGVDLSRFEGAAADRDEVRRRLGIAAGAPLVATVTVLRPGKGLPDLLAALARLRAEWPEAVLVVAGEGPLGPALRRRAVELGVDGSVRWAGFCRDVPRLLAAADLFVLASRWDAFPTALIEALAAGVPVVATRTGGIPEIVDDGGDGVLVPPGDVPALARALSGLLAASAEERSAMGERGRLRARRHFSLAAWGDRLEALYRRVAAEAAGGAA